MKELSNNMLFLHGVSERATDSLRQRKLQLKSDLRQERKNQSEQSEALKEEKESTLFVHLDETNRSKQEKLDKLNSDIDQMTKSIEEIKNVEKETGYGYTKSGGYANKMPGCLLPLLPVAVAYVVIAVVILTGRYIDFYDEMSYYRERYKGKVVEKMEYDLFELDHNAYEEHMRMGLEHEKCNSTEELDKAKLRYQSALEIEQRWEENRKYDHRFSKGASRAIERVEEKVEEKKEYDRFVSDHNAYEEHMRVGQEHEKCNSTKDLDKAKLRYQSALEIEQRWEWNRKYYSRFSKGASRAIERVERNKKEIAEKEAAEKKRAEEQKKMFAAAKRLGSSANCYIVSLAGSYKFRTVKGNSKDLLNGVSKAEVLWESFGTAVRPNVGDLIKSVSYSDGYIAFKTADSFKEGNAVIAAKDASGEILWSWHIWFTDQPQAQVYKNNAGTMMDRNLGATSATPGEVGALGLLYQWGRKDPFLGSSSISSNTVAKSTITWPSPVSTNSSCGTVSYVISNPTTFVTAGSSSDYDWHYSSRDNTLWTTSDQTKSIYDPCPSGWRVPAGGSNGVWSKALGSSSDFKDELLYNRTNKGMDFSGKFGSASTIWYPASGYRYYDSGSLYYVGNNGSYWSASPYKHFAYVLKFDDNGGVNRLRVYVRAYGLSVRCLQE